MKTSLYFLICCAVLSVLSSSGCVTASPFRSETYTGVIINAKSLRFHECDKPRIYSETGEEILPTEPETGSEPGVTRNKEYAPLAEYIVYGTDLNHEVTHTDAAGRPLVLYPIETSWKSESCSIVLDTHSANTLKNLDRKHHLFQSNRVVLLVDDMSRDWTPKLQGIKCTARSYDEVRVNALGMDTLSRGTCQTDSAKLASLIVALRDYAYEFGVMKAIGEGKFQHSNMYTRQMAKKYMKYWSLLDGDSNVSEITSGHGDFDAIESKTLHVPLCNIKSKITVKDFDVIHDEIELHTLTGTFSVADSTMKAPVTASAADLYAVEELLRSIGMTASYKSIEDCKTECTLNVKLSTTRLSEDMYSGIIIDARGHNIQPVISPSIYNEKGHKLVDFPIMRHTDGGDKVTIFPGYGKDLYGSSFAGKPEKLLVVKALAEGPKKGSIVISNRDASLLRKMNEQVDYFQLGLVRIVLD